MIPMLISTEKVKTYLCAPFTNIYKHLEQLQYRFIQIGTSRKKLLEICTQPLLKKVLFEKQS